jgi:hypothetical protein
MTELERLRAIVAGLADREPVSHERSWPNCKLCDAWTWYANMKLVPEHVIHADSCPYRLAQEYVRERKGEP